MRVKPAWKVSTQWGETACNGVHGKNRLASNSLLESLVLQNAAADITSHKDRIEKSAAKEAIESVDLAKYRDSEALEKEYQALVQKQCRHTLKKVQMHRCIEKNDKGEKYV